MISVPGGRVLLSDRRLRRTWQVDLKPYRLAAVPVTQVWYSGEPGRLPVVGVSWWDAVRFCNALSEREGLTAAYVFGGDETVTWEESADGYRLPTEAEWEHACRAGTE